MNSKYEIIIYCSNEDNCLIAEAPELAGCKADGDSNANALANARAIIDEWIETALLQHRVIPQPKGRLLFA
ncbi:MAG: type II toxin-antitoxin system HicB family antitoxin [Limnohabitans sp.]